jgi:hypothetical protein
MLSDTLERGLRTYGIGEKVHALRLPRACTAVVVTTH